MALPTARAAGGTPTRCKEVFVVVSGTLAMLLGDPPERFDLPPTSVVAVEPMTALQVRNEGDELVLFIYGAPPERAARTFSRIPVRSEVVLGASR